MMVAHRHSCRRLGLVLVVAAAAAAVLVSAGAQVWALPFVIGDVLMFGAGVELMRK